MWRLKEWKSKIKNQKAQHAWGLCTLRGPLSDKQAGTTRGVCVLKTFFFWELFWEIFWELLCLCVMVLIEVHGARNALLKVACVEALQCHRQIVCTYELSFRFRFNWDLFDKSWQWGRVFCKIPKRSTDLSKNKEFWFIQVSFWWVKLKIVFYCWNCCVNS